MHFPRSSQLGGSALAGLIPRQCAECPWNGSSDCSHEPGSPAQGDPRFPSPVDSGARCRTTLVRSVPTGTGQGPSSTGSQVEDSEDADITKVEFGVEFGVPVETLRGPSAHGPRSARGTTMQTPFLGFNSGQSELKAKKSRGRAIYKILYTKTRGTMKISYPVGWRWNMSSDDSGTRTVFQSDLFPKHSFCTFSIWRKQEHL